MDKYGHTPDWRFYVERRRTAGKDLFEYMVFVLPSFDIYWVEGMIRISFAWVVWQITFIWEDINLPPF